MMWGGEVQDFLRHFEVGARIHGASLRRMRLVIKDGPSTPRPPLNEHCGSAVATCLHATGGSEVDYVVRFCSAGWP